MCRFFVKIFLVFSLLWFSKDGLLEDVALKRNSCLLLEDCGFQKIILLPLLGFFYFLRRFKVINVILLIDFEICCSFFNLQLYCVIWTAFCLVWKQLSLCFFWIFSLSVSSVCVTLSIYFP